MLIDWSNNDIVKFYMAILDITIWIGFKKNLYLLSFSTNAVRECSGGQKFFFINKEYL